MRLTVEAEKRKERIASSSSRREMIDIHRAKETMIHMVLGICINARNQPLFKICGTKRELAGGIRLVSRFDFIPMPAIGYRLLSYSA